MYLLTCAATAAGTFFMVSVKYRSILLSIGCSDGTKAVNRRSGASDEQNNRSGNDTECVISAVAQKYIIFFHI